MIFLLLILIVLAVALTLYIFMFFPSEDIRHRRQQNSFPTTTGMIFDQLKEQISSLEREVKQTNQTYLVMRNEFYQLKEKESNLIDQLLNQKKLYDAQSEVYQLTSDNLILQDKINRLLILEEENKELTNKVMNLTSDIQKLRIEKERQESFIVQSREKERHLQNQLDDTNVRFNAVSKELQEVKKNSLGLQESLFKQKVMYADSEKELERLRGESEELKEGLAYERNN